MQGSQCLWQPHPCFELAPGLMHSAALTPLLWRAGRFCHRLWFLKETHHQVSSLSSAPSHLPCSCCMGHDGCADIQVRLFRWSLHHTGRPDWGYLCLHSELVLRNAGTKQLNAVHLSKAKTHLECMLSLVLSVVLCSEWFLTDFQQGNGQPDYCLSPPIS